jgi:anti-sigma factor RsiW
VSEGEHRELREMLGAFVLGGLSPDEAARVRAHLETCADCRAELDLIKPVARELALMRPGRADPPEMVPEDLGERVATAVAAERRAGARSRAVRLGLVAAASAAIAASVAVLVMGALEPDPVPLEPVAVTVQESGVVADADLVNHTWGVEIKLAASGLQTGATYRVAVLTDDGEQRPAGEFVGTGESPMRCNLNSAVLRPDAVGFVVLDESGTEVITSRFDG